MSTSSTSQTRLAVTLRRIGDLKPDPKNPRRHAPKQVRQIARSIEAFGFNVPVLVDAQDRVVAGHGRLLACKSLGWEEVPVITLEHLTEAQVLAYRIADNRLTDVSEWDDRLLGEQLKALSAVELTFSLEAIGFDMGEIDVRIEGLEETSEEGSDPADALPEEQAGPPVSRPGDLWRLGPHRVLCGNALVPEDVAKLMGGIEASVVFTDPPYNVPIQGHVSGNGQVKHEDFAMACGEMSRTEFTDFLAKALGNAVTHGRDGAIHYVCMDWRHLEEVLAAGNRVYGSLLNLCVWAKDAPGMGSFYRSQHELVLVFKQGRGAHQNHVRLGVHGRSRSNIWHYAGMNSFGRTTEEGNLLHLHPTVKPVALVADALMDASRRGEIVLDVFLGSGSTLVAAEKVGRVCHGLELDPRYVDRIIRRWQAWSGERAIHAESERPFDMLAEARRGEAA